MVRASLAVALLATAVLAGCTSGGGNDPPEQEDFGLELEATDTTGVLRGVVVNEAIVPIPGVNVTLLLPDPVSTASDSEGAFGFEGLEPGTYFFQVSKLGFFGQQNSAEVVAGDSDPPIVRVVLRADQATQPFWQSQVYEGYIQCTTSVLVLCGAPAVLTGQELTNDRFAWDQSFANNASLIQAEMVWDSTQTLSPELYFEMETLNEGCDKSEDPAYDDVGSGLNSTRGVSPVYATISKLEVDAWSIGETCPVWISVFSGETLGTPLGFTLQQQFRMYLHSFHGYLPPTGWRFTADGDPPEPA